MRNLCGNNLTNYLSLCRKWQKKLILRRRKTYRIYKLQKVLFSISIFLFQSNSQASTLWGTNKGCGICVYNISLKLYFILNQTLGNWNLYIQSQFSVSKNVWIFLFFSYQFRTTFFENFNFEITLFTKMTSNFCQHSITDTKKNGQKNLQRLMFW